MLEKNEHKFNIQIADVALDASSDVNLVWKALLFWTHRAFGEAVPGKRNLNFELGLNRFVLLRRLWLLPLIKLNKYVMLHVELATVSCFEFAVE